jgi:hypothetical protein
MRREHARAVKTLEDIPLLYEGARELAHALGYPSLGSFLRGNPSVSEPEDLRPWAAYASTRQELES